jgi:hypothetical protein
MVVLCLDSFMWHKHEASLGCPRTTNLLAYWQDPSHTHGKYLKVGTKMSGPIGYKKLSLFQSKTKVFCGWEWITKDFHWFLGHFSIQSKAFSQVPFFNTSASKKKILIFYELLRKPLDFLACLKFICKILQMPSCKIFKLSGFNMLFNQNQVPNQHIIGDSTISKSI